MTVIAYIIVLIITGCTTSVLTITVWRQRRSPGSVFFHYLLLAITECTVTAALEAVTPHPEVKIFWSVVEYIGLGACPPLFLAFAMAFSGLDRWLTRRNLLLLAVMPVITLAVAATNNLHHWLWASFSLDPAVNILTYAHGPWFWVNTSYCYLLILIGVALLGWDAVRFRQTPRRQALFLLLAAIIPWAGNIIYIFRLAPIISLDWTPVSFSLTGIISFLVIFRYQFMDLIPVARDQVFDSLADGVIVLDNKGRVVDLNPTAARILELSPRPVIGQPMAGVLAAWPDLVSASASMVELQTVIDTHRSPARFLDLRISPLTDRRGRITGTTLLFRDVTDQELAETRLVETLDLNQKVFSSSLIGILVYKASGACILANNAAARIINATVPELLKQDFRHIASWEKSSLLQVAEVALISGNSQHDEFHLLTSFGRNIWINCSLIPFSSNREPHLLLEFEDVTERRQMERDEHTQRILAEALRDTAEALNSSLDLNVILDRVLVNIGRVMPYDSAELYLFDDQGSIQVVKLYHTISLMPEGATQRIEEEAHRFQTLKTVRETGQAVMIPDVRQDPNWVVVPGLEWLSSHVSAPIMVKGNVIGVIGLSSREPGFFSEDICRPLLAFANEAGIAIENARLYAEVQRLAITDELTGLYNYRALMELGPREFARARRFDRCLAVLFVDIDHFADFNNRYSHVTGNQVLQAVAQSMVNGVRAMDVVARYGGEEFVILLPETDCASAALIAERIRVDIAAAQVATPSGNLGITASIGVAGLSPAMPSLEALIEAANQAEHQAKERGRNQVVMSSAPSGKTGD